MASTYKTPGVYIEEISTLPASVAQVETAIPAFIGFTEKAKKNGKNLYHVDPTDPTTLPIPTRIDSLLEYEEYFGKGPDLEVNVELNSDNTVSSVGFASGFCLYDSMRMFFSNGGGPCYILATASYDDMSSFIPPTVDNGELYTALSRGLAALKKEDEPTLILFPDAANLMDSKSQLGTLQKAALQQCNTLQDRFCIFDLLNGQNDISVEDGDGESPDEAFRNNVGVQYLKYGSAYYPNLRTTLSFDFGYENLSTLEKNNIAVTMAAVSADSMVSDHYDLVLADETTVSTLVDTPSGNASWGGDRLTPVAADLVKAASIYEGYALLSESYPATAVNGPRNQLQGKLQYISFMITAFVELTMTDVLDEDLDGTGVTKYDLATLHGQKVAEGTNPDYTAIENVVRTLISYNKGLDATSVSGTTVLGLAAADAIPATILVDTVTYDLDSVAADSSIFGTGLSYAVALDASAASLQELYEEMVSMFRDFEAEISLRKDNLELLLKDTNPIYANIVNAVKKEGVLLPPSGAIAGVYAAVDADRGVWVAPANKSLNSVIGPKVNITAEDQSGLNVDVTAGKSINAIRSFTGKGTLVWGARTLAGNSAEWRYIPVRRLFNMVEESVKKATEFVVFEPNDKNTWVRTKAMIENFLNQIWRAGGLAGAKPEHAYIVKVGLGETMTAQDILDGKMIIEIQMAAVRPAEFIILRFMHKLQES
ncbi:MAG: phage tail sheath C-terminal domain-containing protein [Crocinitomicaceae bacterium]|nr:phage tail sheath C-terminal domain-containing protein [Crocinitomicaceae bacterium]